MSATDKTASVAIEEELRLISSMDSSTTTTARSGDSLAGKEEAPKLSVVQAIRASPKCAGWALGLALGVILCGFDISIVSSVASLPEFQRKFGQKFDGEKTDTSLEFILPALWIGLWSAGVPCGAIPGSLLAGNIADRFGRRLTIFLAAALSALCAGLAYGSDQPSTLDGCRVMFLVAKTLQGFANGVMLSAVQTYLSECLPPNLLGPAFALLPISLLVGQLVGSVVVESALRIKGPASYRVAFASQWPFTVLPMVVAFFMPESPPWLVERKRIDRARVSFGRLDSSASARERDVKFGALRKAVEVEDSRASAKSVAYRQCFEGADTRRTWIVVFAIALPELFGLPLFATISYFLQTVGMSAQTSLLLIILGVALGLVSNIMSFWTLSFFRRRTVFNVSLPIMAVMWLAVGIAGFWSGEGMLWFISITMICIIFLAGLTCWPGSHVVAAETSSLRLRARTIGFAGGATNVLRVAIGLGLPYMYNPDAGNLGARVGLVFAALCAICAVTCWFLIPEMKNRTAAEIDEMFELRLKTREFAKWRGSTNGTGHVG